ncbi:MAG: laccase domain-containing protein, partial [Candidatus Saccharimonadales bacterium]
HLGEGMLDDNPLQPADALVVTRPGHALFLPLADCVGAVLYDPVAQVLMVSHLGRHSAQVDGAAQSVRYLQDQFASQPDNLLVWLSPAVGASSYPLSGSDSAGLHDVITAQLLRSGVATSAIQTCAIDTAVSADYFSHSQFVAGNQAVDGRFAIVAMMRE